MEHAHNADVRSIDEGPQLTPPDLILQAIVRPTDAPAEVRAAVADTLARPELTGDRSYSWEDITFAASAIALVQGTNRRAEPDTQWVFALQAESPRLGEQLHSSGGWATALHRHAVPAADRHLWRVSIYAAVTSAPRGARAAGAEPAGS